MGKFIGTIRLTANAVQATICLVRCYFRKYFCNAQEVVTSNNFNDYCSIARADDLISNNFAPEYLSEEIDNCKQSEDSKYVFVVKS